MAEEVPRIQNMGVGHCPGAAQTEVASSLKNATGGKGMDATYLSISKTLLKH